jgi:hypothetical protein
LTPLKSLVTGDDLGERETVDNSILLFIYVDPFYLHFELLCVGQPYSNELTRGPPELVQHFRFGARALHVLNLIWFGYITRLPQWGEWVG